MIIDEEASLLKKKQHELIRKLEHKEITQEDYNTKFGELDKQMEIHNNETIPLTVDSQIEVPLTGPKERKRSKPKDGVTYGRPVKKDSVRQIIIMFMLEKNSSKQELIDFVGLKINDMDKALKNINSFMCTIPKKYFFDKENFRLYKKSDLIDENGNPIS